VLDRVEIGRVCGLSALEISETLNSGSTILRAQTFNYLERSSVTSFSTFAQWFLVSSLYSLYFPTGNFVFCLGISFRDRRVYIHPAFVSMAVSPFASRSPSVTVSSPNAALRLRAPAAQNASGSVATTKAVYSADRELTEQLNDDVRQKYVKGQSSVQGLP
jgi:hypothetical protein